MLILIKMITCNPMKFYTEMLHFQESCQMKCALFVYIQFIPTMFSLMINYLNKYTLIFYMLVALLKVIGSYLLGQRILFWCSQQKMSLHMLS